jgi:hypothetical protein
MIAGLTGEPSLTQVFFVVFLKKKQILQYCPLILGCLIIEFHGFIQFIFNGVNPVS